MANGYIGGAPQYVARSQRPRYPLSETIEKIRELERENPTLIGLVNGFDGWRARFLVALALKGTVVAACRIAGISPGTARNEALKNPQFEQATKEALSIAVDELESTAWDLATGALDGKPSEAMLRFILKARKPEVYGDRSKITHAVDKPDSSMDDHLEQPKQLSATLKALVDAGVVAPEQAVVLDAEFRDLPPGAEEQGNLYH